MTGGQGGAVAGGQGRLREELATRTLRAAYGERTPTQLLAELELELPFMIRVDQAHLIMLVERGLIAAEAAAALLRCMADLISQRFAPLLSRPAPRGLYLMYEGYLVERLGPDIGGVLHTGRSRNDLKATVTSLRLREWLLAFVEQAARLQAILLGRARVHRRVVMPIYTHFQAAMPVTYGHYLLGVGFAVGRDLDALAAAATGLRECPLGAGAVAGTDLPIDPARTAGLLGFTSTTQHALDAVASRDGLLRLLGAAAVLAVTLSRLGTDLQLWSTVEFGFIEFPDRLVGGSSAMPQKRNAFLLEHVKAKPGLVIGAWTAAASMMASTPFSNSIEVGTEAVAAAWPGLLAVEQAVLLCQALVAGARPQPDRMRERAEAGFTVATSIANRLVARGVAFRTAHELVGEAVRRSIAAGHTDLVAAGPPGWLDGLDRSAGLADVAAVAAAHSYGGGPGSFDEPHARATAAWTQYRRWYGSWRHSVADADRALALEVHRLRTAVRGPGGLGGPGVAGVGR